MRFKTTQNIFKDFEEYFDPNWMDSDSDAVTEEKMKRLVFHFGESVKNIEDKLYERDIVLNYEKTLVL